MGKIGISNSITMIIEGALNIYTDGSSFSGPRTGGIGIRFITIDEYGKEKKFDIEQLGYKGATNNQMELQACVQALKEAQRNFDLKIFNRIIINSDSLYVVENYSNALFNWSKNGWKNREGRPVENAVIWKDLLKHVRKIGKRIEFNWVKGHSRDPHNKAVDKLARKSAKNPFYKPLSVVSTRRKTSNKSTRVGSVEMKGQRLSIRVITTEYFRLQKLYKYRYEVISKTSKYFCNVDLIFSKLLLCDGHCYRITVNKYTQNPMIMRILSEINCKTGEIID
jgi:ribonuclease HI